MPKLLPRPYWLTDDLRRSLRDKTRGLTVYEAASIISKELGIKFREARYVFSHLASPQEDALAHEKYCLSVGLDAWYLAPCYVVEMHGSQVVVRSFSKHAEGRALSEFLSQFGYLKFKMHNRGQFAHQLVAQHYMGEPPKDMVVNHKDGIKTNNSPSNLEYVTIAENIAHSIAHGMHVANHPERHGKWKGGISLDQKKYQREWARRKRQSSKL